jgi:hypothetical protein
VRERRKGKNNKSVREQSCSCACNAQASRAVSAARAEPRWKQRGGRVKDAGTGERERRMQARGRMKKKGGRMRCKATVYRYQAETIGPGSRPAVYGDMAFSPATYPISRWRPYSSDMRSSCNSLYCSSSSMRRCSRRRSASSARCRLWLVACMLLAIRSMKADDPLRETDPRLG